MADVLVLLAGRGGRTGGFEGFEELGAEEIREAMGRDAEESGLCREV